MTGTELDIISPTLRDHGLHSMGASYDDNTCFAEDETGTPICYDWLRDRDGEAPPVRVQVQKAYVEWLGKKTPL